MSKRVWLPLTVCAIGVVLSFAAATAGEKDSNSVQAVHVGEPFGEVETVEIAALLANPQEYAGKTVRLEGSVASYCHHERGWFALANEDGANVRLITAPNFKVPAAIDAVPGVGEGVVEVIEVAEAEAKHYAGDHGLARGDDDEIVGPQKQVVIRASAAQFAMPAGAASAETAEVEPCDEHGEEAHAESD
jgi:hypothetical protein